MQGRDQDLSDPVLLKEKSAAKHKGSLVALARSEARAFVEEVHYIN